MEIRRETPRVTEAAEEHGIRNTGPQTTPALLELLQRVEGEYREMPGLSLTVSQAERLWGLDRSTCALVLTTLIERRVLRQTTNGMYLRGPSG
jgi:DNA-binding IclR family transcriptional regulator